MSVESTVTIMCSMLYKINGTQTYTRSDITVRFKNMAGLSCKYIKSKLSLFSPQASGVKVTDDVIAVFNDMKVRKAQANEEEKRKRKKAILFCLSKDLKNIVLDEGKEILLGDLGTTVQDPYQHFVKMLPSDDCRYALYDATYETKETKKEDLVFIFW